MLPPQALRPGAEPGLDRQFAHVVGELGGVLAPALAALSEQPRIGIGAQARHTAERALLLDDHGVEAVIVQPQRTRHARGSAADDRHDRRSRVGRPRHLPSPVARRPMVRHSGAAGTLRDTSVPIPKFASLCRSLVCELRNRRTLATYWSSVALVQKSASRTRCK